MYTCETCGSKLEKKPKAIPMPAMVYRKAVSGLNCVLKPTYFQPECEVLIMIQDALCSVGVLLGDLISSEHRSGSHVLLYRLRNIRGQEFNRCLYLSFYRMESGKDEVTGYIT